MSGAPTTLAAELKAWAKRMGYTRDRAAAELRVSRATYDGWCAGRPAAQDAMIRRLMDLIEVAASR